MTTYTLSWYCTENVPRLITRPWWAFWQYDELVVESKYVRKCITLTENESKHLQAHWNDRTSVSLVVAKLMGRNVVDVQLESSNEATPYIPSEYVSVGEKT